jgi:hypothetical protein
LLSSLIEEHEAVIDIGRQVRGNDATKEEENMDSGYDGANIYSPHALEAFRYRNDPVEVCARV